MPWKERCAMDQKIQMIGDYLDRKFTVTRLSEIYGVSRNTIYKWIERYKEGGNEGLTGKSPLPLRHPNATPIEIAREIVALKLKYTCWGPKKLVWWLNRHYPERKWPAVSTTGKILKQTGLVKTRKKRQRTPSYTEPFLECAGPNIVWSADYKGQFKTKDGQLCYPLTISDNYSRYLLCCKGLKHPNYEETRPVFEAVFKEYGLPVAIRTDNGSPFASTGLGGLSKLSAWFIKLGVIPERIQRGHPEQNGRHERMHETLKEATTNPPQKNLRKQQKAFDQFISENNNEKPHGALGMHTPAAYYRPSLRVFPKRLIKINYHGNFTVRQVRHNGEIKWKGEKVFVSQALAGETVGLKPIVPHQWQIFYSTYCLGVLDELDMRVKQGEKV